MTIRYTIATKANCFHIYAYHDKELDLYLGLYINGEEILPTDMIKQMYPIWKIKSDPTKLFLRFKAPYDRYLEFKYINYILQTKHFKIHDMRYICKRFRSYEQLNSNLEHS